MHSIHCERLVFSKKPRSVSQIWFSEQKEREQVYQYPGHSMSYPCLTSSYKLGCHIRKGFIKVEIPVIMKQMKNQRGKTGKKHKM